MSNNGFHRWAAALTAHHLAHRHGLAPHEVYQTSTIGALLDGVYDGTTTLAEVLRHGDFGLGTFNALDGELVILDGRCYRLRADGTASLAALSELTPFAAVTRFRADTEFSIETATSGADVLATIEARLNSANLIQAVRIAGTFTRLRTRTVSEQTRPYPPLTTVTDAQSERSFTNISGTVVGFHTPAFEQGIAVAGFHLHFLDDSRRHGGHLLDFEVAAARVSVGSASELHLSLPTSGAFLTAALSGPELDRQIRRAEGGTRP